MVLNNIHIDIMDYIQPASCTDAEFRKMWAEFEWENKVGVVYYGCCLLPWEPIISACSITAFKLAALFVYKHLYTVT